MVFGIAAILGDEGLNSRKVSEVVGFGVKDIRFRV